MMADKRQDELDNYQNVESAFENKGFQIEENELKTGNGSKLDSLIEDKKEQKVNHLKNLFLKFICGFEENINHKQKNKLEVQIANERKRRVDNFLSINQTKFEKRILNINLIIILAISTAMYIFFSIPPQKHIFSHLNLNNSMVS